MRRGTAIALGAALAFAAVVLARLPAAWVLPGAVRGLCGAIEGSLWSGTCIGLRAGGTTLGELSWTLAPLRLFSGQLAAHVSILDEARSLHGEADLAFGAGGRLLARDLRLEAPLDPRLVPGIPANLRGDLSLALARVEYRRGALADLRGHVELRNLSDRSHGDLALGSYAVDFPGGPGAPVGTLHDLGGPLALEGTARLIQPPGVELSGSVAPRPNAPPELLDGLRALGPADAAGRRPFSVSATF